MSRDRITRGEKLMEAMVRRGTLSEAGKDWLIACVDPMHDNPLKNLSGWPDPESTSSVVRCIKKSVALSKPTGIVGPGYDMHVVAWPFLNSQEVQHTITRTNNQITDTASAAIPCGGIRFYFSPVNSGLDISTQAADSKVISLDADFSSGASRLIGMGLEIHDTTAPLNKQGTCTVYRQPESSLLQTELWGLKDVFDGVIPPTQHAFTNFTAHKVRHPPVSLEEALLLPGSRQWKSEDGCYLVAPFVGIDNPVQLVNYVQPVIEGSAQDESITSPNTEDVFIPEFVNPVVGTDPFICSPQKVYPIHQIGAKFTELNDLSTFNATAHFYIETFPTADETAIVVLATPSAPFDPVALEIMSRVLGDLPVGVPANWNGFGDWFADIVADVGSFLAPILTGVNPLLGAGVGAASAAANAYRNNAVNLAKKEAKITKIENKTRKDLKRLAKQEDIILKAKKK